jgi:hypothetical protein
MECDKMSRSFFRRILACAILGFAMAAQNAGSIHAVGCYASGCNYKDPIAQGCSATAQTAALRTQYFVSGGVSQTLQGKLRYSSACVSNWAQGLRTYSGSIAARMSGGPFSGVYINTSAYSNMLDGSVTQCARGEAEYASVVTAYGCA